MAKKNSRRRLLGIGGLSLIGLCIVCFGAGAIMDALGASPQTTEEPPAIAIVESSPALELIPTDTQIPTDTLVPTLQPTGIPVPTDTQIPTDVPPALAECIPAGAAQTLAVVTHVVDGDTIDVVFDNQEFRIRYIGMDTPESTTQVEPFGEEASAKNQELVDGKAVILVKDVSETDRYGRLLRYVFVDGHFVNHELVRQGFANVASYPPDVACIDYFRTAEQEARNSEVGLWAAPPPTATIMVVVQPTAKPASQEAAKPAKEPKASGNCHPSYPDVCLAPDAGDYDCAGGSGNGPNYVPGPITVYPPDPFDLDRDGDGIGCEG